MFTQFAEDKTQTIAQAFRDICDGQDPWVALGDFSHDFFGNYPDSDLRMGLVRDPVAIPEEPARGSPMVAEMGCEDFPHGGRMGRRVGDSDREPRRERVPAGRVMAD